MPSEKLTPIWRRCAWLPRVVLGGVLAWAAWGKMGEAERFAAQLADYRLLPACGNQWLAVTLPWMEVCAGLCLCLGLATRAAAQAAVILLTAFLLASGWALGQGLELECGCFPGSGWRLGPFTLLLEAVLLALAFWVVWQSHKATNLGSGSAPTEAWPIGRT